MTMTNTVNDFRVGDTVLFDSYGYGYNRKIVISGVVTGHTAKHVRVEFLNALGKKLERHLKPTTLRLVNKENA